MATIDRHELRYLIVYIHVCDQVNGKYVIKSGTDFRNLSKLVMTKSGDNVDVTVECVDLDSSIPEDEDLKKEVIKITG